MSKLNCPGQDTQYWTAEAIYDIPCSGCGRLLEFFKDDLRRSCPECGTYTVNPKNDMACAAWCPSAAECLAQMGRTMPETTDEVHEAGRRE